MLGKRTQPQLSSGIISGWPWGIYAPSQRLHACAVSSGCQSSRVASSASSRFAGVVDSEEARLMLGKRPQPPNRPASFLGGCGISIPPRNVCMHARNRAAVAICHKASFASCWGAVAAGHEERWSALGMHAGSGFVCELQARMCCRFGSSATDAGQAGRWRKTFPWVAVRYLCPLATFACMHGIERLSWHVVKLRLRASDVQGPPVLEQAYRCWSSGKESCTSSGIIC